MPKVICALENASEVINGIKFVKHEDGERLISASVVNEPELSIFMSIPGYTLDESEEAAEPEPPKETAAQRKARLKAEQEAAAAEQAAAQPEPQQEAPAVAEPVPSESKDQAEGEVF